MRVLLVSANTERSHMRVLPLGLAGLAAATRAAGHEATMLDLAGAPDPAAAIARECSGFNPRVIGLSVRNIDNQSRQQPRFYLDEVRETVNACRGVSAATIVLGGAGYSIFPEAALDYLGADMGIQGEGEWAFPLALARLEKGEPLSGVPGLYLRGEGLQAPRSFAVQLPPLPPSGELLLAEAGPADSNLWIPVQTRRGCPLRCSYCSTPQIEGGALRCRLPDGVVDWLGQVAAAGFRRFYFVDNVFNLPAGWALDFCRRLSAARLDIEWRCIVYPRELDDELVEAMAEAGCREVSLGFESGAPKILVRLNKRFGVVDVRESSAIMARHGIRRLGFLLLGGPGETRASVRQSLQFVESLKLEGGRVTTGIRIYPGTGVAREALAEGMVASGDTLLQPCFYLAPGLAGWLDDTLARWDEARPGWVIA